MSRRLPTIGHHGSFCRRLLRAGAGALALGLLAAGPAAAQTVYYNITAVSSVQLSNAVRVKIETDGSISADVRNWWSGGADPGYYLDWAEVAKQTSGSWSPACYPQRDKIRFHLSNARPGAGSVADVSKYPVSHVRFVTTDERSGGVGVDVEVVLHKPMRIRKYRFGQNEMWDAYLWDHHDPAWFEMALSPDKRSVIVTVTSDRLPERREHRRLADVPEAQRQLRINADGSRLTVHARNAALADVAEAVNREAHVSLTVSPDAAERVISAELPDTTVEEFTARLSETYGLASYRSGDRLVLCDALQQSASSQAPVEARRFPVHNLKARTAANLLPNFLEDCVRVDEDGNALVVSGPQPLLAKVAADLANIDQPETGVKVTATFLEATSTGDALARLGLAYQNEGLVAATAPEEGGIVYSTVGRLPEGFTAQLAALAAKAGLRVADQTSLTVTSGQTGEIFAGLDKYIVHYRTQWDEAPTVEPVSAGAKLTLTPRAGREHVSLQVQAETKSVEEVDPATGLPVISTRSASGTFQIRSGETIAIGGLDQTQDSVTVRSIPILGRLPLLGRLFRTKAKQRTTTHLTVLLTATITAAEVPSEPKEKPVSLPAGPRRAQPGEVKRW